MEISKRAEVALKLINAAIAADDDDAAEFMAHAIERDSLWRYYSDDDGASLTSYQQFAAQLDADAAPIGTRPVASAGGMRPLCQMTHQERYALRQSQNGR